MKKYRIEIRVTKKEKELILNKAKTKNQSMSTYILNNCLGEKSPEIKRKINVELNNLMSSNRKVENNINQLAKRVNSNRNLSKSDYHNFEILFKKYTEHIVEKKKNIKQIKKIMLR
jgi:uncharacterized protein (DUF1778 family)